MIVRSKLSRMGWESSYALTTLHLSQPYNFGVEQEVSTKINGWEPAYLMF